VAAQPDRPVSPPSIVQGQVVDDHGELYNLCA
jgi:hypothetical protein